MILSHEQLREFVRESNRIEGIVREPAGDEISIHGVFLAARRLLPSNIEGFVNEIAGAALRDKEGMNVRVADYFPPPGHPRVRSIFIDLVHQINEGLLTPYHAHLNYESLHPFMDGNGRSGRAIWAWQMKRDGLDPFALPFLHRFYYQALEDRRG